MGHAVARRSPSASTAPLWPHPTMGSSAIPITGSASATWTGLHYLVEFSTAKALTCGLASPPARVVAPVEQRYVE
jgi:hypothetical protein